MRRAEHRSMTSCMTMGWPFWFSILVLIFSHTGVGAARAQEDIFADGFESGDMAEWTTNFEDDCAVFNGTSSFGEFSTSINQYFVDDYTIEVRLAVELSIPPNSTVGVIRHQSPTENLILNYTTGDDNSPSGPFEFRYSANLATQQGGISTVLSPPSIETSLVSIPVFELGGTVYMAIYLDGEFSQLESSGIIGDVLLEPFSPLRLGRFLSSFTAMTVEEIRIWKTNRTPQEISDFSAISIVPENHPNLEAYYSMGSLDLSTNTWYDDLNNHDIALTDVTTGRCL